jgi:hypothetical protein
MLISVFNFLCGDKEDRTPDLTIFNHMHKIGILSIFQEEYTPSSHPTIKILYFFLPGFLGIAHNQLAKNTNQLFSLLDI